MSNDGTNVRPETATTTVGLERLDGRSSSTEGEEELQGALSATGAPA
jgi:hypothetical protein